MTRVSFFVLLVVLSFCTTPARAQLTAADLVLVVNKRQPVGLALAQEYARTRGVPDGRIIEIDVPDATQIDFQTTQIGVAKAIRDQLNQRQLIQTVRCLVLFYGVPLRMTDPLPADQRAAEAATIKRLLDQATEELAQVTADMEELARHVEPGYTPQGDGSVTSLIQRVVRAENAVKQNINRVTLATSRQAIATRFHDIQRRILPRADRPTSQPAAQPKPARPDQAQINQLLSNQDRPQSRTQLRNVMHDFGTLAERISLLQQHERWMGNDDMAASIDSDLSLLLAPGFQRIGFIPNPMHFRQPPSRNAWRPLMVARIDGPTPEAAQRVIRDSFKAESDGLTGTVVVDARGNTSTDGYGQFDQKLRDFAQLIKTKTSLRLVFDNTEPVLRSNLQEPYAMPKDVMLYVGWYALQSYQSFGTLKPGCVGYHIASFELTELRQPSGQWVYNLLNNGIAATMGPVAEPYIVAFPNPDEFFPLLLADRMTLAEAYWRTTMVTSWRGVLIGDPLYRPFRNSPPLKVHDMPADLRPVRPVVER